MSVMPGSGLRFKIARLWFSSWRVVCLWCFFASTGYSAGFDPGEAGFRAVVQGIEIPYRVMAFTVMPGEDLPIRVPKGTTASASTGRLVRDGETRFRWVAPVKPGLHRVELLHRERQQMTLNVFVLRPLTHARDERLDGYRVGQYPQQAFRGLAAYEPPRGLVEVTAELVNTRLSPHFTLGQFLCKQARVNGKEFMLFRPELLLKLETILQTLNKRGIAADTLFIMSGYRTPHYNASIGNSKNSRHIYGGAADWYVDVNPRDGRMDDVNRDGKINRADAGYLYSLVDGLSDDHDWLKGGLGEYGSTASHGPFVHVDVRGHRARWGRVSR